MSQPIEARYAELLRVERQYDHERSVLRSYDDGSNDRSRDIRAYNGVQKATARAKESFEKLFNSFTPDELRAFGAYRRTH